MHDDSLNFFRAMLGIASPSGFEWSIQKLIRSRMKEFCDTVRTDVHGNVIGIHNPDAPFRVMLSGHCDEIGLMITHIDDKGSLYFAPVGGVDPAVLTAQRVRIHTEDGPLFGVIGRKPIHLMEPDERGKALKIHELWIDIGAHNAKEARKAVAIGDYATLDAGFETLRNDLVAARGFDDRAGAFVVVETLRRLQGRKLKVGVYGVASVQEELGLRGARTSAYGIDPHVGIAVDVGFASDYPGADPKRTGECKLGKGPVLHRGPNITPLLAKLMEETARKSKIPFQITAEPAATGTDANAIQVNKSGVAAALVSIPNRYMHTPVEMVSLEDIDNTSKLIADVVSRLSPDSRFIVE